MTKKEEKTRAQIKAERDLMMAQAAIKLALQSFHKKNNEIPPPELQAYWDSLSSQEWAEHLQLFTVEVRKLKQTKVKELLFDLKNYVDDCIRLTPKFNRTKEEILLMIAIGQINVKEFIDALASLPSNREKLDRRIEKEIKTLDWQDKQDLNHLDELTDQLDEPRIKKTEIENIEKQIENIEKRIQERKTKRGELAIKLVEWKARGTIDIAGEGKKQFRLDA